MKITYIDYSKPENNPYKSDYFSKVIRIESKKNIYRIDFKGRNIIKDSKKKIGWGNKIFTW